MGKQSRRVLITGASRGLGLEFVRQYLAAGDEVAALARDPEGSKGLQLLLGEHDGRLTAHSCDVADDASVKRARDEVRARWKGLDLLINNAGIGGDRSDLAFLDFADMSHVFEVNAIGPLRMASAMLPLLRGGRDAVIAMVTSRMGSIGDNTSGGAWAYRMSKAALNMAGRNLMHELTREGIHTLILHPGWVRTDMGGEAAPLGIPESVAKLIGTIDTAGKQQSGAFIDLNGASLPW